MKQSIVLAGGLCVVAVAGIAAWTLTTQRAQGLVFSPTAGTTSIYQVGQRIAVREPGDDAGPTQRWAQTYGLMRYRAEDFGDARQLHITPLTLSARDQDGYTYTPRLATAYPSNDLDRLKSQGFDMPFDSDGDPALAPISSAALTAVAQIVDAPAGNPILGQLVVPALPRELATQLDARVGAEHRLADYRGLTAIRATVEQVDDDALTIRLASTDQTRAVDGEPNDADAPRLLGRLRVNRRDGWIESMTLVRRDQAEYDGHVVAIDRVTRAVRRRELTTGDMHTTSDPFWGITDEQPRDVEVRQSPADTGHSDPAADDPALDRRETALRVALGQLHLGVRFCEEDTHLPMWSVALNDLTLYDRDDRPVGLPIQLAEILPAWDYLTFGGDGRLFLYTPLDGDPAIFDSVARAEATLTYRKPQSEIVTIALDDRRHALDNGPARVSVEPDAEADNVWWLRFENRDGYRYRTTWAQAAPGVHAMAGVAPHDSWVSAAEAELLAQVDSPSAGVETLRVQADHAPAAFPLERLAPGEPREYSVEFKRRESP
ncbi:hypothetical protein [Salinisphaera aquimarina]|uniref:DUF4340 domain-containing protein n=1 Tax=Salinisphaera aquimarina TaxID=2094031 RepID=A0ABV7EN03_9GAMM